MTHNRPITTGTTGMTSDDTANPHPNQRATFGTARVASFALASTAPSDRQPVRDT